jgi:hypothetical protein
MRHKNWQNRLSELINTHKEQPFDFSNLNCLFWAFKGIEAIKDVNFMPDYEGKATSVTAGKRALKQIDGVKTVQECLMKRLEQTELQHIAFARPGDIVFIDEQIGNLSIQQELKVFGPTPGICYGLMSYFLGETSLVEVPTIRVDSALWVS